MREIQSYQRRWLEYRKQNRLFWVIALTYLPGHAITSILLSRTFGSQELEYLVSILLLIAFTVAGFYRSNLKCPRCGRPFFRKTWWYYSEFGRKCVHCKLPKWATTDSGTRH